MSRGRSPALVGFIVVLSIFVLWLSATQISRFAHFGALPPMAYRLQSGVPTAVQSIRDLVPLAEDVRAGGICQGVFVKSGFTILLAALDIENQDAGYDAWEAAMQRAESFGRHALGCLPTSGDFWLKLARLHQATGEQPDEIFRLLTNSQLYAPAEPQVVAGRYAFYSHLSDASLNLLHDTIGRDIRAICSRRGNEMRRDLTSPSPAVRRIIDEIDPRCVIPSRPV